MTEDISLRLESISPPVPTQEQMVVSAIRAGRLALGWTQGDLARASGVSEVSIARMETAAISPRLGTISKIQGALQDAGVTININHPAGGFTLSLSPSAVAMSRKRYVISHSKSSGGSPAPNDTTTPTT